MGTYKLNLFINKYMNLNSPAVLLEKIEKLQKIPTKIDTSLTPAKTEILSEKKVCSEVSSSLGNILPQSLGSTSQLAEINIVLLHEVENQAF